MPGTCFMTMHHSHKKRLNSKQYFYFILDQFLVYIAKDIKFTHYKYYLYHET